MKTSLTLLLLASASPLLAEPYKGDLTGCGKKHLFNGITQYRHITSNGQDRSYGIHLPSTYSTTKQYPVIVGFHGSSSIGLFLELDSKLSEARFTGDKIVVYPNGVDGSWAGPSYAKTTQEQDLSFVGDLLGDVRREFCVDSSRIYATGLSNGGGFVGALACNDTVGGEFAAFAPAAGSFYSDLEGPENGCKPARSVTPVLEFHGGKDGSVDYEGGEGEGGTLPRISDWVSWWAKRNGCTEEPVVEDSHDGDVHHTVYSCQDQEGVVQHYKTDSQKHNWPSTEINFSQIASGDLPTHLMASSIIQEFFMKFTRPA